MNSFVDKLCVGAWQCQAMDLFLIEGEIPRVRIHNRITDLGDEALGKEDIAEFWEELGAEVKATRDRDASYVASNGVRFRVNLHRRLGRMGAVLRRIKTEIPQLNALGLPDGVLTRWAIRRSGLILVTGPTGSGKSTTLAATLDWLNEHANRHVVTIEDPIEYLFESRNCLFTQREIGIDTDSFAKGLRGSLRQSPDVIFVGEIRDSDTARTALQASETGHLVLSTLHSSNVGDTMERLTSLFGERDRQSALLLLANQLIGILCQQLLPSADGEGLVLVTEHVENEGATRNWIRENKSAELSDFLQRQQPGSRAFIDSILAAHTAGRITGETAELACGNPQEFRRAIRGISGRAT